METGPVIGPLSGPSISSVPPLAKRDDPGALIKAAENSSLPEVAEIVPLLVKGKKTFKVLVPADFSSVPALVKLVPAWPLLVTCASVWKSMTAPA